MKTNENESEWMRSMEVQKALKIDGCHLMHLRIEGKLRFKKERNAFLYSREDMERERKTRSDFHQDHHGPALGQARPTCEP